MSKKSNAALCYDCLLTQVCQRKNVRDLRRIPKCLLRHSIGRASGADVVRDAAPRLERAGVHGRPPEVPEAHPGARGAAAARTREWACALSPPDRRTSRSVSSSSASTRSPGEGPRGARAAGRAPGGVGDDAPPCARAPRGAGTRERARFRPRLRSRGRSATTVRSARRARRQSIADAGVNGGPTAAEPRPRSARRPRDRRRGSTDPPRRRRRASGSGRTTLVRVGAAAGAARARGTRRRTASFSERKGGTPLSPPSAR